MRPMRIHSSNNTLVFCQIKFGRNIAKSPHINRFVSNNLWYVVMPAHFMKKMAKMIKTGSFYASFILGSTEGKRKEIKSMATEKVMSWSVQDIAGWDGRIMISIKLTGWNENWFKSYTGVGIRLSRATCKSGLNRDFLEGRVKRIYLWFTSLVT